MITWNIVFEHIFFTLNFHVPYFQNINIEELIKVSSKVHLLTVFVEKI